MSKVETYKRIDEGATSARTTAKCFGTRIASRGHSCASSKSCKEVNDEGARLAERLPTLLMAEVISRTSKTSWYTACSAKKAIVSKGRRSSDTVVLSDASSRDLEGGDDVEFVRAIGSADCCPLDMAAAVYHVETRSTGQR